MSTESQNEAVVSARCVTHHICDCLEKELKELRDMRDRTDAMSEEIVLYRKLLKQSLVWVPGLGELAASIQAVLSKGTL